jgi:Uma2 family endonuclease
MPESGEDEMAVVGLPALDVVLRRHRFSLDEYHRMGEMRIFDEDERVELIEGDIVRMPPIGWSHASEVDRLTAMFTGRLRDRVIVRVQGPIVLPAQISEPLPDLILLRPRPDFYRFRHPEPGDVLLVVKVMDSSARYDRRVKLPLYARAGVAEVWLVDLNAGEVEVCRDLTAGEYRERQILSRGDSVAIVAFPDVVFSIADLIG